MKNIIISMMVLSMSLVFAGCRGSNSTYTTEPVTTTAETQAETPTINNGNGPITTAPADTVTTETTENSENMASNNTILPVESNNSQNNVTSNENTK